MANPWDSLSPEAQAELQGYAGYACDAASGIGDAAMATSAHAWADVGNGYQQFLTGRNLPPAPLGGTMETTTQSSEPLTGQPESYSTALLKHAAAEGAEREAEHWRGYGEAETTEDAPDSAAPSYGVGEPSQAVTPAQPTSPTTQEPDAYEPDL
jgi:hypothetical protein